MKLYELIDECKKIKDYLSELVGDSDKIDMGIKFQNMSITYIIPEIFEKKIDNAAKKVFQKEENHFIITGKGQDGMLEIESKLQQFEKELIKSAVK